MSDQIEYLFSRYEAIASLMAKMRGAANDDKWEIVIGLQDEYQELVETLKPIEARVALDDGQRARKHDLLRRILSDDAILRDLANPRLARLSALLASNRNTRALQDMYSLKQR
jgi:flagellar protein FliT